MIWSLVLPQLLVLLLIQLHLQQGRYKLRSPVLEGGHFLQTFQKKQIKEEERKREHERRERRKDIRRKGRANWTDVRE